jgi:hypothetical protein
VLANKCEYIISPKKEGRIGGGSLRVVRVTGRLVHSVKYNLLTHPAQMVLKCRYIT